MPDNNVCPNCNGYPIREQQDLLWLCPTCFGLDLDEQPKVVAAKLAHGNVQLRRVLDGVCRDASRLYGELYLARRAAEVCDPRVLHAN